METTSAIPLTSPPSLARSSISKLEIGSETVMGDSRSAENPEEGGRRSEQGRNKAARFTGQAGRQGGRRGVGVCGSVGGLGSGSGSIGGQKRFTHRVSRLKARSFPLPRYLTMNTLSPVYYAVSCEKGITKREDFI